MLVQAAVGEEENLSMVGQVVDGKERMLEDIRESSGRVCPWTEGVEEGTRAEIPGKEKGKEKPRRLVQKMKEQRKRRKVEDKENWFHQT